MNGSEGQHYWFEGECPLCREYVDIDAEIIGSVVYFLCPECLWPVEVAG